MRNLILFAFAFFAVSTCFGAGIEIEEQQSLTKISDFEVLRDTTELVALADIVSGKHDAQFQAPYENGWFDKSPVHWLRFTITNKTGIDDEWILDFQKRSQVRFYFKSEDGVGLKMTGHLWPYNKRDYRTANKSYILLPIKDGETLQCWVRIESKLNGEVVPGAMPWDMPESLAERNASRPVADVGFDILPKNEVDEDAGFTGKVIYGFLGVFLIMLIYNFFVFLSTRLRSYGYYLLVLLFGMYHIAFNSGYIISLASFIEGFPVFLSRFEIVSSNLLQVVVVLFVQEFLKLKTRYPKWNKAMNIYLILSLVFIPVMLFNLELGTGITGLVGLAIVVSVIVLGIKSVRAKYPSAVYFLLGYVAFLFSMISIILTVTGVLPPTEFVLHYSFPLGGTLEIIMFSFALANMINVLRQENAQKQQKIIHQLVENEKLQTKVNRELEQKVAERTKEIALERDKSEKLLLNILPEETAAELKQSGKATPHYYESATVLFTDFKGFTGIAEKLSPGELVQELDYCFQAFDEIVDRNNLEKIKTIGDAYMCAGGIPTRNETSAHDAVNAGIDLQQFMNQWNKEKKEKGLPVWELRVGVHTGPVTAGVVGKNKFAYDIWGDTVNIAARMESSGEAGRVNISESTYLLIKEDFDCQPRGKIKAKNKGEIDMYFVEKEVMKAS